MATLQPVCPCGAHLVGSVPLADARTVFSTVARHLGRHVKRIPDGETGVRSGWIAWQSAVFGATPGLQSEMFDNGVTQRPAFFAAEGTDPAAVRFPPLGYAEAAIASWQVFRALQDEGRIPPAVRFQVCLPTPLAPVHSFVHPRARAALEPAYEARLLQELQAICAAVPHASLALQWDTAIEFAVLEGVAPSYLPHPEQDILERLVRLGRQVPADVELGYHLCYGDAGHKHFKEPADAARLVSVANHLAAHLQRPLNWVHLPVPRDRDDDAYFAPLAGLALQPQTEVYLGLVHRTDGTEGTARRIAAARRHLARFGVGTECGFGRRPPETVEPLLALHAQASAPLEG